MKNFLLFALLLFIALRSEATVYYVDASAANNAGAGTSWTTAKKDLQEAIDTATNGDEIWVKAGTYNPTTDAKGNALPISIRLKTFLLKDGVAIYGGFNGTESVRTQRDFRINHSILSGEIGSSNVSDNCYHVVMSMGDGANTILDGLQIIRGNSIVSGNGSQLIDSFIIEHDIGGGLHFVNSAAKIKNCVIRNNSTLEGGGLNLTNSTATIENSFFVDNNATSTGTSAGIKIDGGTTKIINCVIARNSGTGINSIGGSHSLIMNCVIAKNTNGRGGYHGISTDTIINTIIYENASAFATTNNYPDNCDIDDNNYNNISYCIIDESWAKENHNIQQNPLFTNTSDPNGPDNIYWTADDGYVPTSLSLAAESGHPTRTYPTLDLLDSTRAGITDRGAYEVPNACPHFRVYVDQNVVGGNHDGSSWANAFTSLEDVIDAIPICAAPYEVWVAKGTYYPQRDVYGDSMPTNPRTKTFKLFDDFRIYGGFAGNENFLNEREISINETILSGDIGVPNTVSDNCLHVLVAAKNGTNCRLNGLTITGGNSNLYNQIYLNGDTILANKGGGLLVYDSGIKMDSCTITINKSNNSGGGISLNKAILELSHSNLNNNTCIQRGSCVYIDALSYCSSNNNLYMDNSAVTGGTLANEGGELYSIADTAINNYGTRGGVVYSISDYILQSQAETYIRNSVYKNNTAYMGGAIYGAHGATIDIQGTNLEFNSADFGGGIYSKDSTEVSSTKDIFYGNTATQEGGGACFFGGASFTVTNGLFAYDTSAYGGAIAINDTSSLAMDLSTVVNNRADSAGGAMHIEGLSNIEQSILYNNLAGSSSHIHLANGISNVTYSLVGWPTTYPGIGNINGNPMFINLSDIDGADNIFRTSDDGLGLLVGSPAINAGISPPPNKQTDIKGVTRIAEHDLGAYEHDLCPGITNNIIYVDSAATGGNLGNSWSNAFKSLQSALDLAKKCNGNYNIWVAKGTYYPSVYINGNVPSNARTSTFYIEDGIKIYGGFNGTETSVAQRNISANPTILSGDIGTPNDNTDNCYHVFMSIADDSSTIIDGFIIEKGNANSSSNIYNGGLFIINSMGGGIYMFASDLEISNCEIRNNTASGSSNARGGGLGYYSSSNHRGHGPSIKNTVFRDNYCSVYGGALGTYWERKCVIDSCQFINNSSGQRGGAFHSERYMMQATNTIFDGNSSVNGGAISCPNGSNYDPPIIVSNCLFKNNTASGDGAVIDANFQIPRVQDKYVNCTFRNNTAGGKGGVYNSGLGAGILTFQNCYFGENSAATGGVLYNYQYVGNGLPYNKKFDRCVFEKNSAIGTAGGDGGGVFFQRNLNDTAIVTNCLFIQNYSLKGPVIYNGPHYNNVIGNCTFYKNYGVSGNPIHFYSGQAYNNCIFYKNDTVNINFGYHGSNSMFEQLNSGNGINRIYGNPIFVNENNPIGPDSIWGTADDGLRLSACSPAINGGSMQYVADSLDLMGTTRVQGDSVDMGAYEGGELPMQIRTIANTTDTANAEITDATGWTHYCNCDTANMSNSRYMLSLKKNGNDIGHVDSSNFLLTTTTNNLYGTNTATDLSTALYVTADTFFAFNRYWQVAPTNQPASSVEVRFPYSTTDFTDLQGSQPQLINHSDMAFFKVNGAHNPHSLTVPSSAYNDYANGSVTDTATWKYTDYTSVIPNTHLAEYVVNSFSGGGGGFGNGTNNGPLPVSYVNFSVYKQASSDLVKWTTVSEINNSHFNVQRSSDAINFETLGTVNSKADPSANSGGQHLNYSFVDKQPQIGSNYYRLEQVDLDGNKSYSKVVLIVWTDNGTIRLYPNPTNDVVYIDFSLAASSRTEIKLIDMSGRVVKSILSKGEKGKNHAKISMGELVSGVYHIQLLQNDKVIYSARVRKD